jgi:hypothetical protein
MNSEVYSRYIFIEFENLKQIKFDKLEQVCDKVFVFVNKDEKAIPFILVQQLQKLGENVQWVPVNGADNQANSHFLSFYLGQTHEQVDEDIEFAIVSEDQMYDLLIDHLNDIGRSAIRVTRSKEKSGQLSDLNEINWSTKEEEVVKKVVRKEIITEKISGEHSIDAPKPPSVNIQNQQLSEKIANETIKRLVMSGNRPAAIDALKSYILLQYNNADVNRNIDLIIRKLENTKEIEVKDREVLYKF